MPPSRTRTTSRPVSSAKRTKTAMSKYSASNTTIPFTMKRSMRGTFPPQMTTTLRYVETVAIAANSGSGFYVFSCNGLYDPNITGTGHQPLGFGQLIALYNHYKVKKSNIKINILSAVNAPLSACCYVDDDATVTSYLGAFEQAGVKSIQGNSSAGNLRTLTQSWDGAILFGDTLIDKNHAGNASANPSEISNYVIYLVDPSAATNTWYVKVEILYTATFYELKQIAQS